MTMDEFRTVLSENGRIVVPAVLRKELGIKPGDELVFTKDEKGIHLRTKKQTIAEIRKLFALAGGGKKAKKSLSEELLEIRRQDAEKE